MTATIGIARHVNFYKHHLGNYEAATAHLTWDEDCAYRRLMAAYYRREKPLPADSSEVYRLVRAIAPKQRQAVDSVLREFFDLREDGWHNKRCDEEIAAYQAQASTNRRIARGRTVPRTVLRIVNGSSTVGSPNHKPLTKNQEPEETLNPIASSAKALSAGDPPNGNAVAYIPCNDGSEFGVSKELAEELAKLYPAVDVPQTLNEIRGWNLANPQRRKTRRGVLQHINSWMTKEQNRGPK